MGVISRCGDCCWRGRAFGEIDGSGNQRFEVAFLAVEMNTAVRA